MSERELRIPSIHFASDLTLFLSLSPGYAGIAEDVARRPATSASGVRPSRLVFRPPSRKLICILRPLQTVELRTSKPIKAAWLKISLFKVEKLPQQGQLRLPPSFDFLSSLTPSLYIHSSANSRWRSFLRLGCQRTSDSLGSEWRMGSSRNSSFRPPSARLDSDVEAHLFLLLESIERHRL